MYQQSSYSPHQYALSFQKGEQHGFAYFFRLLYSSLTLFAHKIVLDKLTAEEIASSAFIKTWQRHGQFNSPEGIRAYLYQVVRHDSLKYIKQREKEKTSIQGLSYLHAKDHEANAFQHLVAAETSRQLMATLDLLPPQCGKIFRKLYMEGKTVRETAEELNLSTSTVRTQQKRGLETIRLKLGTLLFLLIPILCQQL